MAGFGTLRGVDDDYDYAITLDGRHVLAAVRYVERNSVRAGLVARAWEYPWSSAAGHCGLRGDPLVRGDGPLVAEVGDWRSFLLEEEEEGETAWLRARTRSGRPCGSAEYVSDLERRLGRILAAAQRGPEPQQTDRPGDK